MKLLRRIRSPFMSFLSKYRIRILFVSVISLFIFIALLVQFRYPILHGLSSFLIYESKLEPCDIAVMLGGGMTERIEKAIELYQNDVAPQILLTIPKHVSEEVIYSELFNNESRICQAILDLRGIPDDVVHWATAPYYSTFEELVFIKEWLKNFNHNSAVIVPGLFQSRRAKWTLDHVFRDADFKMLVAPASGRFVSATNWWTHEEGIITVENEYLKNIYYWGKRMLKH